MKDDDHLLRDVYLGSTGYRLTTWDTDKVDNLGKTIIEYEFRAPNGKILFDGADFACSPLNSIDGDESIRSLLGFLTLSPGSTDDEFFENYTEDQMEFAETEAEGLQIWLYGQIDGCGEDFEDIEEEND